MLHISVLGEFRVRTDEHEVPPAGWKRRKAAAIVKILALAPGHRLHREQMMELLWPELDPEQAANNLHQTLHAARRTLETDGEERYLLLRDQIVQLNPDVAVQVDAVRFEEAAAEARRRQDRESYQHAIDLYTADLLPDDLYEPWASDRRETLREEYIALVLTLAEIGDRGAAQCGERRSATRAGAARAHAALRALRSAAACHPAVPEPV